MKIDIAIDKPKENQTPSETLMVHGFTNQSAESIINALSNIAMVKKVMIRKNFNFLRFKTVQDAIKVMESCNGKIILESQLSIQYSYGLSVSSSTTARDKSAINDSIKSQSLKNVDNCRDENKDSREDIRNSRRVSYKDRDRDNMDRGDRRQDRDRNNNHNRETNSRSRSRSRDRYRDRGDSSKTRGGSSYSPLWQNHQQQSSSSSSSSSNTTSNKGHYKDDSSQNRRNDNNNNYKVPNYKTVRAETASNKNPFYQENVSTTSNQEQGTTAISTSDNTHYQEEMFSPVKIETVFELNYLNDKVREINGDSDDDSEGERGYHRRRDRIFE